MLIFVGLTAYDTQKLKMIACADGEFPGTFGPVEHRGVLTLYLDFINLFLFILRIMGNRKN